MKINFYVVLYVEISFDLFQKMIKCLRGITEGSYTFCTTKTYILDIINKNDIDNDVYECLKKIIDTLNGINSKEEEEDIILYYKQNI